jgi:hypothetical protein
MMMIIASIAVALVSFIVYALERRSKKEPIVWEDAAKLSLFSGIITSGVVFASTADVATVVDSAKVVTETASAAAQDMFVGAPSF